MPPLPSSVPLSWYLILSAVLFALGVAGFLFRKNIITVFMSIELMLNAVNLTFIAFSYQLRQVDGTHLSFQAGDLDRVLDIHHAERAGLYNHIGADFGGHLDPHDAHPLVFFRLVKRH